MIQHCIISLFIYSGSATIFKYNITKREDMEEIRKISAVCPQFNVQFEFLTVKENLKTFAKLKGILSNDIESEVSFVSLFVYMSFNSVDKNLFCINFLTIL